jgi:hypothetical protein
MSPCLSIQEKKVIPKLNLHNPANVLNRYSINSHKILRKKIKDEITKPNIDKNFKKQFILDTEKETRAEIKSKEIKNIKKEESDEATIKDLNRIITLFDEKSEIGLTELIDNSMLDRNKAKFCLNFLLRINYLKEKSGKRGDLIFCKDG